MFKVGDKVKIKGSDLIRDLVHIHKYPADGRVHYLVAYKGDVPMGYWEDDLTLVEPAPETEKEATKMKIEVKETTKAGEKKFPCIRKGKTTGNLYLFHQPTYGYDLDTDTSSTWEHTVPFTGTVTLTQE